MINNIFLLNAKIAQYIRADFLMLQSLPLLQYGFGAGVVINSLQIGNSHFPVSIMQGPLAGISAAPFRRLIWRYSKPAYTCTEMISAKTLIYQSTLSHRRYITKDLAEGPVCFQLASHCPVELGIACKIVTDKGADLIDLNCGCPKNKIRTKGLGSSLLTDPLHLYKLVTAMKQSTSIPISIKIRVDGNSGDRLNQDIAKAVSDAGADLLVVHGRHWTESYDTACHYDQIRFFVESLKIPVIGNGDIACAFSLKKMLATGCHGVMIGRAGVGQPWLISQLIAEIKGTPFTKPCLEEIGHIFIEHVTHLAELLNNEKFAVLQARKFAKYYGRDLINKMEFITKINSCITLSDLQQLCLAYFLRTH